MCIESLDTFLEYQEIQIQTKIFLENSSILDDALKKLLNNKNKVYSRSLQGDKLDKFVLSLQEHFKWIKKKCIDDTIAFNDYDSNFDPSLRKAYCEFYHIAKNDIHRIKQPQEIKENLEDYFSALIDNYCDDKAYTPPFSLTYYLSPRLRITILIFLAIVLSGVFLI